MTVFQMLDFGHGSALDAAGGANSIPPAPIAEVKAAYFRLKTSPSLTENNVDFSVSPAVIMFSHSGKPTGAFLSRQPTIPRPITSSSELDMVTFFQTQSNQICIFTTDIQSNP